VNLCVQNIVNTFNILKSIGHTFTKLSALVLFGTRVNASRFGIKRSKLKVMVESNVLENACLALIS